MVRDLDRSAADIADGEMSLGEWFLKLDAGAGPWSRPAGDPLVRLGAEFAIGPLAGEPERHGPSGRPGAMGLVAYP